MTTCKSTLTAEQFEAVLADPDAPRGHAHLVGVCGVGMAALAIQLRAHGFEVSGCDAQPGPLRKALVQNGVDVLDGHDAGHVRSDVDWVVRSTAVPEDADELKCARDTGIPVFMRGWTLSRLLPGRLSIVVTGTHGKTTTSAFIVQLLRACGRDPSFCIGGEVGVLGGVARATDDKIFVTEGDESDGSVALYKPELCVITNIDFDHMEHFGSVASFERCFRSVVENTQRHVIYCRDDERAHALCRAQPNAMSYGLHPDADVRALVLRSTGLSIELEVAHGDHVLGTAALPCGGDHNARNLLAGIACGLALGMDNRAMLEGAATLELPHRRMETIVSHDGVTVISDYAHHPTEVRACISTVRQWHKGRLLVVFQPHRYTRTKALGALFPPAFAAADSVVLVPVYSASESPLDGGRSWDLYAHFRREPDAVVARAGSLKQAWEHMRAELRRGDVLLVLGAGDVEIIAEWAKTELEARGVEGLDPSMRHAAELEALPLQYSQVRRHEPLGDKTSWKVGGRADVLIDVRDDAELRRILGWCHAQNVPATIVGAGSNVLVSDLGVRGVVFRLVGAEFREVRESDGLVWAAAGASNRKLLSWMQEHGYGGLEFLEGVPGTVGGALRMNAGAWGGEIACHVVEVRFLTMDGTEVTRTGTEMGFAYRRCDGLKDAVALEAAFRLERCAPEQVRDRRRELAEKRTWWKEVHSAGSVFKNPEGAHAGELCDQAGLKGLRIGGARIYEQHANVIATEPHATASDVEALIDAARGTVKAAFGIKLEPEIRRLPG